MKTRRLFGMTLALIMAMVVSQMVVGGKNSVLEEGAKA
jgi:hypothetical protein